MAKEQNGYTENQKSAALAALKANGGNVSHTARQLGIPASTISSWRDGVGINEDITKSCEEKKRSLVETLETVAFQLVEKLPGLAEDAKISDLALAFAIVVDKMQLLKGQPTGINLTLNEEQKRSKLEQMKSEFQSLAKAS